MQNIQEPNRETLTDYCYLPNVKRGYQNIYVGDVTLKEICDALQKSESLEPVSFYSHIISLHKSKVPGGSTTDILNNLSKTFGQLEIQYKTKQAPCEWLYHLYDSIIALALYYIISTKNSSDESLKEVFNIIVSSWEKSRDSMPVVESSSYHSMPG